MTDESEQSGSFSPDGNQNFNLAMPFWIDTPAYTTRDRAMFVAGYEFCQLYRLMRDPQFIGTTISRENESRVRMMAGRLGRKISIEPCEPEKDPDGTWSYLEVEPTATD